MAAAVRDATGLALRFYLSLGTYFRDENKGWKCPSMNSPISPSTGSSSSAASASAQAAIARLNPGSRFLYSVSRSKVACKLFRSSSLSMTGLAARLLVLRRRIGTGPWVQVWAWIGRRGCRLRGGGICCVHPGSYLRSRRPYPGRGNPA